MTFDREQDMTFPVSRFFRRRDFTMQGVEIQFFEYRMDLYGYSPRQDRTVAIELKLSKWMRAFQQALVYQLCSDFVYVALPVEVVRRVDQALLRAHGIGLIAVERARCREILPPSISSVIRGHYRAQYLSVLRGEIVHG